MPHIPTPHVPMDMEMPVGPDQPGEFGDESIVSMEDCEMVSDILFGLPAMFYGDHLEPPEKMTRAWQRQLYKYCTKKGIDPGEYLFDELGITMATLNIAVFMVSEQKKFKRGKREEETAMKPSPPDVTYAPPTRTPEVIPNPASGSGGDNLPEEPEEMEEVEDERESSDADALDNIEDAAGRSSPEEPSE